MFVVIQKWDFSGRPLNQDILRTVYAVDKDSETFLVAGSLTSEFIWIPIASCVPVRG